MLDLSEELVQRAQAEAERLNIMLDKLVEMALSTSLPLKSGSDEKRITFPTFVSKTPGSLRLTNEDIRRLETEDDLRTALLTDDIPRSKD